MLLGDLIFRDVEPPEWAVIYIIYKDDEAIYVGTSWECHLRFKWHYFGYVKNDPDIDVAREIVSNVPYSFDWRVEFVELPEDCMAADYWIRNKEAELVRELRPKLNIHYNPDFWVQ